MHLAGSRSTEGYFHAHASGRLPSWVPAVPAVPATSGQRRTWAEVYARQPVAWCVVGLAAAAGLALELPCACWAYMHTLLPPSAIQLHTPFCHLPPLHSHPRHTHTCFNLECLNMLGDGGIAPPAHMYDHNSQPVELYV